MGNLAIINFVLMVVLTAFTGHQFIYILVKLFTKPKKYVAKRLCRYGVVIAARNEEAVIAQLIDSVHRQDYPRELVDVFVVADNCTDRTAEVARNSGAVVYERFNKELIGKGYALNHLFQMIKTNHSDVHYDGYFIFDADNLLEENYITEMNKVFTNGYRSVTSYRNTKNYGDNWLTASYGLWFLREAEYLNYPRSKLNISCAVSGTGFLVSDEILEENGGWNYFLMVEDLEFTADRITKGEKIGYCPTAMYYDEQPKSITQSLVQRSRWLKGGLQVTGLYSNDFVKGILKNGSFSCYDMLMIVIPMMVITFITVILNLVMFVVGITNAPQEMGIFYKSVLTTLVNSYFAFLAMGGLTLLTEWKKIRCPGWKKLLFLPFFPIYMVTYLPSVVLAIFGNIQWKPIPHTEAISISDISGDGNK